MCETLPREINEFYPLQIDSIRLLRESGGSVYAATGAGQEYLVKRVRGGFRETARTSLAIVQYLWERGFPVPEIIKTRDGRLLAEQPGAESFLTVANFIPGKEPEENEDLEAIGETCGRMHALMRNYPGPLIARDKSFFVERYLRYLADKRYPAAKIAEFRALGDHYWQSAENLPRGFCHGDFHRGNLLKRADGTIFVLDFDTACRAFPLYDAMTLCDSTDYFHYHKNGYEKSRRAFADFLRGYERFSSFTKAEKEAFPALIGVRHFQLQATILEMFGLDCVDEAFVDEQLDWLKKWQKDATRD